MEQPAVFYMPPEDDEGALPNPRFSSEQATFHAEPAEDCYVFPASFAQQRLWVLDQLQPGTATYNMALELRLSGPLDMRALAESLNALVERHEALRTTVATEDGQPVQVIAPALHVPLPLLDLSTLARDQREEEAGRITREQARRPFELAAGPLLRALLLHLGSEEHVLLLTMHHVISDGWSTGVLLRELGALYAAQVAGMPADLPELAIQYADFSQWQREWLQGEVLQKQLKYWREQLAGAPAVLELPADRPRPVTPTYRGALYRFALPAPLTAELRQLSQREGVTLFMTLLAAFQTLLARYTAQEDLVVGSPIAGRSRPETEGLIGFFVNMLVLRTDLSGDPRFRDVLRRVREAAVGAYAHQDLPFERLVEELHPERDPRFNPLFQVMFILQNALAPTEPCAGVTFRAQWLDTGTSKFDLTLNVMESAETLEAWIEYSTDLFDVETIVRMSEHYQILLKGIVADPSQRISALPLLTPDEWRQLLVEWNETRVEYDREACLHELVEAQVRRSPERVAVRCGADTLTYTALDQRANQLAHYLRVRGVGPEVPVGICVERSVEMLVGLLGILKAGGAYLPLDPAYPQERLAYMLADAGARVLVTQRRLVGVLPAATVATMQVVDLEADWEAIAREADGTHAPASGVRSENLAYLLYTSGSTGRPKGVMVTHRNVGNFCAAMNEQLGEEDGDEGGTWLAVTRIAFDISILELFWTLTCGFTVVVHGDGPEAPTVGEELVRYGVTHLQCTPSLASQLLLDPGAQRGLAGLRVMVMGGEALPVPLVETLNRLTNARLLNMYAPTETTIYSTAHEVTPTDVAIGRPIANTQLYVLDAQQRPVPIGVPGELYIGGEGVARGYWQRPELTQERFVPDPFVSGSPPEVGKSSARGRLYRTGDRVRQRRDGVVEYIGRVDQQVKLRGYRIELGEIEAVLRGAPGVREAAVVVREAGPGDQRLTAYVVPDSTEPTLEIGTLRQACKEKLPDYMVPAAFVLLDALPLTPSGKVDRRALPAPDRAYVEATSAHVEPRTPVEQQLTAIWEDLLGVHPIGVQDNFFDLGGHSLLAARLMARIQKAFDINLPLSLLFRRATIEGLASSIEQPDVPEQWSSLVAIRPSGTKPPFFCVHGIFGDVLFYADLAHFLDADRPLYGLQARGLDGTQEPFARIEDMASSYIEEIRAVQPQGPYYLGGYSSGGSVAYEMARQLAESGQEVAVLALFDHANPSAQYEHVTWNRAYPLRFLKNLAANIPYWFEVLRRSSSDRRLKLALQRAQMARRTLSALMKHRSQADTGFEADNSKYLAHIRETPGLEYAREWPEYRFKVLDAQRRALVQYVPGAYRGRVTLLRARRQPIFCSHDLLMGWGSVAHGGVEVVEVPGGHHSILHEPYVQELAAALHRCWSHQAACARDSEPMDEREREEPASVPAQ